MIKKHLIFTLILVILLSPGTLGIKPALARVDPNFNPNFIISDEAMLDWDSMSLSEIQNFLEKQGSFLANHQTLNAYGTMKTAAEIIYEAATANYDCQGVELSEEATEAERQLRCRRITTVSPKFLLVLIQKESSLIEDPSPSQRRLDFATGYFCFDGRACDPRWQGFGKQVNSAALQFLDYLQNPRRYRHQVNEAYVFNNDFGSIYGNPLIVVPANRATAALYNYTPHVFDGNYNVWRLLQRYFPQYFPEGASRRMARYPDGSLLQVSGQPGVWLIKDGYKRPFLSWGALVSRHNPKRILQIDEQELRAYPRGAPIKYPNYSILRSPRGQLFLIVDKEKRRFDTDEIFKNFGFHPDEVINASFQDLAYYPDGQAITADSTYLTGALLQNSRTGGVYYVRDGWRAPIIDRVMLRTKFKDLRIQRATEAELAQLERISPVLFPDGELLRSRTISTVYLISNGKKRPFFNAPTFESLGYNWDNIIEVSPQLLHLYPFGEIIVDIAK